jgi:hypothetical protein
MSSLDSSEMVPSEGAYHKQANYGPKGKGMGRGMEAKCRIPRGACIIEEAPLLLIVAGRVDQFNEETFYGAGEYSGGPLVQQEFNKLSYENQSKFTKLTYPKQTEAWLDSQVRSRGKLTMSQWRHLARVAANAFDASDDEADRSGNGTKTLVVFNRISLFNHSCKPNAIMKWHPERKCGMVHALREIVPGEQIFLSYIHTVKDTLKSRKDRQTILQDGWDFECACTGCHLSDTAVVEDDNRRKKGWDDWTYLDELPWPSARIPMHQNHLATLKWPEGSPDGPLANEADIKCKDASGKDVTDLHREHRRIISYYKSVIAQFKALEINDADM